jgi:hypothetical protein
VYYNQICQQSLVGGTYKAQISGKNSIIRKKVLSFPANGLRLTLTIDSTLGQNYITLPMSNLKDINLATMLAIVNRAPSINNRCIYVCEIIINKDKNDNTAHLNPYIIEGLGADQDGDEINLIFYKKNGEIPSFALKNTIIELKAMSWKYGRRHTSIYNPRYSFSQHLKLILYLCDKTLEIESALWRSLPGNIPSKCRVLMNLGCSILKEDVDEFITNTVCVLVEEYALTNIPINEMLTENGILSAVVNSGANGSKGHIDNYLKNIYSCDTNNFKKRCVHGFNRYIKNSPQMSREGTTQFILLKAMCSISYHQNIISFTDIPLYKNVKNSAAFCSVLYNNVAYDWLNDQF